MKPVKTLTSPEAFQLIADETRRKIVFLLRVKEMTVSQIAADLNLTPQAVYHHIKRLLKGELVEVSREVRVDHIIESYYRATAEVFNLSFGNLKKSGKFAKEQIGTILKALNRLGFDIDLDQEKTAELIELHKKLATCCGSAKLEDEMAKMDDVDLVTKIDVQEYAELLAMSDEEFSRQHEDKRRVRELLKSMTRNNKEKG
jgi:DNA-binding transcriptional ArsR family regulator